MRFCCSLQGVVSLQIAFGTAPFVFWLSFGAAVVSLGGFLIWRIFGPAGVKPQAARPAQNVDEVFPAAFTSRLKDHGRLAIALVVNAVAPSGGGASRLDLEIDALNAPKRHVSLLQVIEGAPYEKGDKVYLLIDPADERSMAVLPVSATGGQKLPRDMNRLDPYALGPEILRIGMKGQAAVLAADRIALGNSELEARGYNRFHLRLRVAPENGDKPFETELYITLTAPEKIQRMATPGALVPVRYDSQDHATLSIDSITMGYGDPYAETLALFRQAIGQ